MRELTDSERIARDVAKSSSNVPYLTDDLEHYIFDMGFIAALDYQQAQIAALQAENERLRGKLFKAAKSLKRIIKGWRDYAAGDYCQTYNPERGKGLRMAADDLENYVYDAYRGEE